MSGFLEETIELHHRYSIGDDLSELSVSDIEQLIEQLHQEIDRLREEHGLRGSSREQAEALFRY
ncbi:DUF1192 domain-containing protein [Paenochrobactrum sp. BZR 588]|uniref:DUF1192 domain-containing protein n=1 Tax=Paenochrobactrum TaxID=999488 RepID=UPI0035BC1522